MSTAKKKSAPKVIPPTAKYNVGQKLFIITSHKGKPEELNEVKVFAVKSRKIPATDYLDKVVGTQTHFTYAVDYPSGKREDEFESSLYPNYTDAAKVFAKSFLLLLK